MFKLKKISVTLLAFIFAIQTVAAALVSFTATTKLDLLAPASTLYILSGSGADSITFSSNYNEAVIQIPAGATFKIGSSAIRYFSVIPSSATVTLTFRDTFIDASGFITSWIVESSAETNISIQIHVPETSQSYKIYADNAFVTYASSNVDGLIEFSDSLNGEKAYGFNLGNPPSGSTSGSRAAAAAVATVSLPTSDASISPTAPSETLAIAGAVTLAPTEGIITQAIQLYNLENIGLTVDFSKDTKITTAGGETFSDIITAPKIIPTTEVSKSIKGGGSTNIVHAATNVDVVGQSIRFNHPVRISIPIDISKVVYPEKLKAFYYDKQSNRYKIAGDGGQLSADQKTFGVEVDHFTLFTVIESDATEISMAHSKVARPRADMRAAAGKTTFQDIQSDIWFAPFVAELASKKIMSGYSDGSFQPAQYLNRAEVVKIATTAFSLPVSTNLTEKPFSDVPTDAWFAPFVAAVKNSGVVSADAPNFRPDDFVNRAEALKILLLASGLELPTKASFSKFNDVPYNDWFIRFVNFAETNGIIDGFADGTFRPAGLVNRAEIAKIVSVLLELKNKSSTALAATPTHKLSFWQKLSPRNLLGNLLNVFQ
ncbi:S-layer homology domain-containing protein [Candidatus Gracilibacteria bacterium]|nr:S-layer homology domain-containing protein [Candidatus Gracilibacteria bacterium]MCF7855961.1 S-layer homology domain-containing protein [Candidatus Gracilibacteria bacterium]MCF7896346.1 S-layer homology domain-containing protein [Candidatus Gracilibacteria bacterium]